MYVGTNLGAGLSMPLAAYLCEFGFAGGWPSAFYVLAVLATAWTLAWHLYATSEPSFHKWISQHELDYLTADKPPTRQEKHTVSGVM